MSRANVRGNNLKSNKNRKQTFLGSMFTREIRNQRSAQQTLIKDTSSPQQTPQWWQTTAQNYRKETELGSCSWTKCLRDRIFTGTDREMREKYLRSRYLQSSSLEHKYSRKKHETFKELDVMLTTTERHNWKYVDRKVHKAIKESDVNTI